MSRILSTPSPSPSRRISSTSPTPCKTLSRHTMAPRFHEANPQAPFRLPKAIRPPLGYLEASRQWVSDNRAVTAALVAVIGTGAFIVWRRRRKDKEKRRAKRAKNGARAEVVVLAGSPHSPLTKSLALDLERRGFIVYIPVNSVAEEQVIQQESRADIRALNIDITSVVSEPSNIVESI